MRIHEAAEHGDIEGVRRALAGGLAVDTREPVYGRTSLMVAAASPRAGLSMVRFLVEQGAEVNARSWTLETAPEAIAARTLPDSAKYQFSGDTALTLAASTGDLAVVQFLLDAGANITATTTHGYDALINATYGAARLGGHLAALVALLLDRGAVPDRATTYGETALKVAAGFARFDVVAQLLAAGADPAQLKWTRLHSEVVFGSLADVHRELAAGAAVETGDRWGRTALHLSLQVGDLDKVHALRAAGATLAVGGADSRSPLVYAITPSHPTALAWLLGEGCDPEATDSAGRTPLMEAVEAGAVEAVRMLLAAGARATRTDQFGQQVIAAAQDLAIVQVLLAHGADLNAVNDKMRLALFGMVADDALELPREVYLAGKARRFGADNPEVMDVPFWHAMIRSRVSAYSARYHFGDTQTYDGGAVWCFERFGRTLTALPDGRYVEIAGEHEDHYDPDFCIYNDVVVYHRDGSFTLYGYPETVFPPTDFHTATLVDGYIYLIGSLGYQGRRRYGATPVYRVSWETWHIERVETRGTPPGWISNHSAVYDASRRQIVVSGGRRVVRRKQAGRVARKQGRRASRQRMGGVRYSERYVERKAVYTLELATMTWRQLRA